MNRTLLFTFRVIIAVLWYLGAAHCVWAQNIPTTDSLQRVIAKLEVQSKTDPKKALTAALVWVERLQPTPESEVLAEIYFLVGNLYRKCSQPDSAYLFTEKALPIFIKHEKGRQMGMAYNQLGLASKDLGDLPQALENYQKAEQIFTRYGYQKGLADALNNIGVIYRRDGQYSQAAEYLLRSLRIREILGDTLAAALANGNLGNLFQDQQMYDEALRYYFKSLSVLENLSKAQFMAATYNNIGLIYTDTQQDSLAMLYLSKSIEIFKAQGTHSTVGAAYQNMGVIFRRQGKLDEALDRYLKALQVFQNLQQEGPIPDISINIGEIYQAMQQYDKALPFFKSALKAAVEQANKPLEKNCYDNLYKYYEQVNDLENAFFFLKKYMLLKDSLFNLNTIQQVASMPALYELAKKDQENQQLLSEKKLVRELIKRKETINKLLGVSLISLVAMGFYFYQINQKKKNINTLLSIQNKEISEKQEEIIQINQHLEQSQKQLHQANEKLLQLNTRLEATVRARTAELQKTNKELDTFLYQSSHALRRPLVQITGLLNVCKMAPTDRDFEEIYHKLDLTTASMDTMLKKLVMASEINLSKLYPSVVNFNELVCNIWNDLLDRHRPEPILLNISVDPTDTFTSDKKLMVFILENLLENAILYRIPHQVREARVEVLVAGHGEETTLTILDNGVGIEQSALGTVFNMFTVCNSSPKGVGLGLYIVDKAVKKLDGTLKIDSLHGEHTMVTLHLPKMPLF